MCCSHNGLCSCPDTILYRSPPPPLGALSLLFFSEYKFVALTRLSLTLIDFHGNTCTQIMKIVIFMLKLEERENLAID